MIDFCGSIVLNIFFSPGLEMEKYRDFLICIRYSTREEIFLGLSV